MQVKKELCTNSVYQLHSGNNSIWSSPWCPVWNSIHDHLILPVTYSPLPVTVSDLWQTNTHNWNVDLIADIFYDQAVQAIAAVPTVDTNQQDILRWTPAAIGQCSVKNVYRYLSSQHTVQLPQQGSEAFFLRLIRLFEDLGRQRTYLHSSKPLPGGLLEEL